MKYLKKKGLDGVGQHSIVVFMSIPIVLIWTATTLGQLGMGDSKGIVQQRLKLRLVHITGKLLEIKTHPCENTTGKADLGTHLILKEKQDQELDIHLGPTSELSDTIKLLKVGTKVDLFGFRTNKMSPSHYVAKTLILPNHIIPLRDSEFRPYWSNNRFVEDISSRLVTTTGKRRTYKTMDPLSYYPKCWQRCYFQDGQKPRWRRRCRGKTCDYKWE